MLHLDLVRVVEEERKRSIAERTRIARMLAAAPDTTETRGVPPRPRRLGGDRALPQPTCEGA